MALDLTVHIDGPELGLNEELEGGGKVVVGLPLAGCLHPSQELISVHLSVLHMEDKLDKRRKP
jgi:hypothetical protein